MSELIGTGVIDQELWERVNVAFPAVNAAIDRHLAARRWVPPADVPLLEAFDGSGWPRVQFPFMPSGKEAPDYSRLFGPTAGSSTPVAWTEIPELADVIDYVAGRADLAAKLDTAPALAQDHAEGIMWFIKLQAADLVLSVVDRARALGHPHDSETLLTAYREREQSLLAAELKACLLPN